jgi:hypothetical protein
VLSLLVLAALVAPAYAAVPVVELSTDDLTKLAAREVVIRQDPTDNGTYTIGVIDVNAPPSRVFDAVIDFEARIGEVGGLRAVSRYLDEPDRVGARWDLTVVGKAVSFTTLYDLDRTGLVATYQMDKSQPNDIENLEGAYAVLSNGTGSRLIYRSLTDSGVYVPGFVRNYLTNNSLVEVLGGMRTRAEK